MFNDRNKDGFLDRNECFFALKQLGHVLDERGLQQVTRLMDKNGDGRISFQGRYKLSINISPHQNKKALSPLYHKKYFW